jgi:hypothetical protein
MKNVSAIMVVLLLTASALASDYAQRANADLSKQAYAQIKLLVGKWIGKSTKGWTDRIEFNLLAGGSAVEERSFDAHPGETMLTIFHMDGDRLMLTHYCAAKNQPRLLATNISPDSKTIEFTFTDATNLHSRDKGHMDKAIYRFIDNNHFTTRWTWYLDGKEKWMEEIQMERISSANTGID